MRITVFGSSGQVMAAYILLPLASLQGGGPDLSGMSSDERESIEAVCLSDKMMVGPAAYNKCIQKHVNALRSSGVHKPGLAGLNTDERESIEAVCLSDKMLVGPVAYDACLGKQLRQLQASAYRSVDMAGLTIDERQSIQSVCLTQKMMEGPAAYDACVAKQLNSLVPERQLSKPPPPTQNVTNISVQTQPVPPDQGVRRLSYFIGTWNLEGFMKASPFGPAGKMTGTHRNEWASGNSSMLLHWNEQRPSGSDTGEGQYSYDSNSRVFTYSGRTSDGEKETSTGTVSGGTWTWISTPLLPNGQNVNARFQITEISATTYSFEFAITGQNGEWTTVLMGQANKAK